ncbi:MAG: AAA family ATPase, partial [Bradymonadaceae bacterium]
PWTDLYALGCIVWELVCGRPPFRGDSLLSIAVSHESDERPPLDPQFPVPEGLERWIHRAMAVEPDHRFGRAAEAMWALPGDRTTGPSDHGRRTDPEEARCETRQWAGAGPARLETLQATVSLAEAGPTAFSDTRPAAPTGGQASKDRESTAEPFGPEHPPPIPEDWRPDQADSLPAPLVGAGLGLFGLREPPFVNRRHDCDAIWKALRNVVEERTSRTVFVSGETGTGKSRLAEWMATRAHEVGTARVLRAPHTRSDGRYEGLQVALEQTLRTVKLDREEVFDHLRKSLPPLQERNPEWRRRDARAITEYLRPTDDDAESVDGPRYRFSSPDQKRGLLVRVLRRLSHRRPVFLWIDDLQWGEETVGVLEQLGETPGDRPELLVVATIRPDVLREQPSLEKRLHQLAAEESAVHLPLEPLSGEDQRELLEGLLPLESRLADRLAERTEGRPLFAMQVLAHWIEKGEIQVSSQGFRVPEGREAELPEDIHELWMERIDRLAEQFPTVSREGVFEALERAAALGREVDGVEWREACRDLNGLRPGALRDALVERGLGERTRQGWAFTHGMLVDSLGRRARESGRWTDHHRWCAELLEAIYPEQPERTAARRADHWLEAGELERTLDPLLQEAERV